MTTPSIHSSNAGTVNGANALSITLTNAPPAGGLIVVGAGLYDAIFQSTALALTATGGTGVTITPRIAPGGASESPGFRTGSWTIEYTTPPTALSIGRSPAAGELYGNALAINVVDQDASYIDVVSSAHSTGTSTTPTASGLPDLTAANSLVIGFLQRDGGNIVGGPATDWTQLHEVDEDNDPGYLSVIYRTPGATGAYDPAWTLASSAAWFAWGIAIKGTAGMVAADAYVTLQPLAPPRRR